MTKIALRGSGANIHAVGAEIRVKTGTGEQVRVLQPVRGFLGCDPAEAVFGLGEETIAYELTVRWPSGKEQSVGDLAAGYRYLIAEAEAASPITGPPTSDTLFAERRMPNPPRHVEREFDDFAVQPLLPNKLSLIGPAMAWGDIDGNLPQRPATSCGTGLVDYGDGGC